MRFFFSTLQAEVWYGRYGEPWLHCSPVASPPLSRHFEFALFKKTKKQTTNKQRTDPPLCDYSKIEIPSYLQEKSHSTQFIHSENTAASCHLQRAFGVRKGLLRFYAKKTLKKSNWYIHLRIQSTLFLVTDTKFDDTSTQLSTGFWKSSRELQRDRRTLHHHAVRQFRPRLGAGHSGRLPGVHGAAPRRLPAAVAAQMDGDAG